MDNDWVAVDDELPPKNVEVLVYSPTNDKMQICVRRGGDTVKESCWMAVTTRNSLNNFTWRVTHWMPKPKSPEGKSSG